MSPRFAGFILCSLVLVLAATDHGPLTWDRAAAMGFAIGYWLADLRGAR